MSLIGRIRNRTARLASVSGAAFLVAWLALAAAPCALAMLAEDTGHICPQSPPAPCQEVWLNECDQADSFEVPRVGETTQFEFFAPPAAVLSDTPITSRLESALFAERPPIRAGPRPHLLHSQFNE